jgi:hypothetical protein
MSLQATLWMESRAINGKPDMVLLGLMPFKKTFHEAEPKRLEGMRSSTIWTSAADTRNLKYYFHTQHNRKLRMVDLRKVVQFLYRHYDFF